MFEKIQNIVQTMHLTILITHPYFCVFFLVYSIFSSLSGLFVWFFLMSRYSETLI